MIKQCTAVLLSAIVLAACETTTPPHESQHEVIVPEQWQSAYSQQSTIIEDQMSDTKHNLNRSTLVGFRDLPRDYPIDMLNLIRLRDKAKYEDGREATGAEAYDAYRQAIAPYFKASGAQVVWSGNPELVVSSPSEEKWDMIFVVRYPTGQAFLDMIDNPNYQAGAFHRIAALEASRLIRLKAETGLDE